MSTKLQKRPAWAALSAHYEKLAPLHLRELFAKDPGRGERLTLEAAGIFLDYSKNRVTDETLALLEKLADESELRGQIDAMFRGDKINVTENRAALHVALRAPRGASIVVDGENVVPHVHAVLDKMSDFANRLRSGAFTGHTGKRLKNVVNVGIGGSDLGPVMAYEALRHYADRALTFRFVSNVDGTDFAEATWDLDPAETLFVISSKTFTTLETMTNAQTARAWSLAGLGGDERAVAKHFVAVSTNAEKVSAFGIDTANMFGFWDWVGGRYSMDSAIGLSTCSPSAPRGSGRCWPASTRWTSTSAPRPSSKNLPGSDRRCCRVWYNDFFGAADGGGAAVRAVPEAVPRLPPAADDGEQRQARRRSTARASRSTPGPIYWGEPGTNGQHSFYQLIHQGTRLVPVDFIAFGQTLEPARQPPRPAGRQRVRAGRGAGVRQDRRRGVGRGDPGRAGAASRVRGEPPHQRDAARPADARRAGQARGAVRARRLHAGRRSGASTRSTSGASSWGRCWRSGSSPS